MTERKKAFLKLIILAIVLIIIPVILYVNCRDTLFNVDWLKKLPEHLSKEPGIAAGSLIGLQILQVIICILPGQPIQFAASYMFGTVKGYLISITGAIIGAFIAFYIAKLLGAEAVRTVFGADKVDNYRNKINSGRGVLLVLLLYLVPGLPKDLLGYVAGISRMNVLTFIVISSIGRSPGMLGSLLIGKFFSTRNYTAIAVIAVVCIIILAVCWFKKDQLISFIDRIEAENKRKENQ